MKFILKNNIPEIYVREIAMMFYPEDYKTLPLEVSIFDNKVTAKIDNHIHTEEIKLNRKNTVKKAVYILLSRITGKTFPYGILTGVKPLAVPYDYKDLNDNELIMTLMQNHLISKEKAKLLINIKSRQKQSIDTGKDSLYINVPFCPSKCTYCSFPSYVCKNKADKYFIESYIKALIKEIKSLKPFIESGSFAPAYIYIGGGTPSILNETLIEKLLLVINNIVDMSKLEEFTFEAGRSDMITAKKLDALKKHNVTRISLNPQSTNDAVTASYNRDIPYSSFLDVYNNTKKLGFNSINCDLILGLDTNNLRTSYNDINKIIKLKPDNITLHTLALKRASDLNSINYTSHEFYEVQTEILNLLKENNYYPYYLYRQKLAVEGGENIGMDRDNKICYYNIMTMNNKSTILAVGAGGAGKIYSPGNNKQIRVDTGKDPKTYIKNIDSIIEEKQKKYKELLS